LAPEVREAPFFGRLQTSGDKLSAAMLRIFGAAIFSISFYVAPAQSPPARDGLVLPEDMACARGPRAAQWNSIKKRFRMLLEGNNSPFRPVPADMLAGAIKESIKEIEDVKGLSEEAVSECGFGRLFIQLLSIATIEQPAELAQYLQEHPKVASPVMTMLLDIPWPAMAESGWPFMGILAQLNYQKAKVVGPMLNMNGVDGLASEAISAYFDVMTEAQKGGDMVAMATASQMFLRNSPPGSPYATLTAMATEAATSLNIEARWKRVQALQDGFKQVITSPSELDISLAIRWPLWAFCHVAVDVFAADA